MRKELMFLALSGLLTFNVEAQTQSYEVPLAGNAFVTHRAEGETLRVSPRGIMRWSQPGTVLSTYFSVDRPQELHLQLEFKAQAKSEIAVVVEGQRRNVVLNPGEKQVDAGVFKISKAGYAKVDLQGISSAEGGFPSITAIQVKDAQGSVLYSNEPSYYYWARRGPSCHLNYTISTEDPVEYFYSEVTVPEGQDPVGSYFMADGFSVGYFGMQVNSNEERRVLFSVWSPFETDDPKQIPEDHKIVLKKKGTDTHVGEFGNEGSGGQSYLIYPWKAGQTYSFLLKGTPAENDYTDFTAWFKDPNKKAWILIASWRRPKTTTYLKGLHSFLENFQPDNGYLMRSANYGNQWIRTTKGAWIPVQKARFSVDNTYRAKQRIDATGGVRDGAFYLQNGGFFDNGVAPQSGFIKTETGKAPKINLKKLP